MSASLRETLAAKVREIRFPDDGEPFDDYEVIWISAIHAAAQLIAESPELAEVEAKIVELNQEVEVWKKNRELARKSAKEELDQQKEYSDDLYAELTQLRAEVVGLREHLNNMLREYDTQEAQFGDDYCWTKWADVEAVAAARAALGEGEHNA